MAASQPAPWHSSALRHRGFCSLVQGRGNACRSLHSAVATQSPFCSASSSHPHPPLICNWDLKDLTNHCHFMRDSEDLSGTHPRLPPQASIVLKYLFRQTRRGQEKYCALQLNASWLSVFNHESLYCLCALYNYSTSEERMSRK